MVLNRVLLIANDPKHPFYDEEWCGPDLSHHDCYFEPISSCTMDDVATHAGRPFNAFALPEIKYIREDVPEALAIRYHNYPEESQFLPPVFMPFLEASPVDPAKYRYWWRAQTVAFIVRPNARSLKRVHSRKLAIYPAGKISKGTISVHVRHGDKWTEVPDAVPEDPAFSQAAEELYAEAGQAWRLKRDIFLSTEDPQSVEHFQALGVEHQLHARTTQAGQDQVHNCLCSGVRPSQRGFSQPSEVGPGARLRRLGWHAYVELVPAH